MGSQGITGASALSAWLGPSKDPDRRPSLRTQAAELVLGFLAEQHDDLRQHAARVARLASGVCEDLGMAPDEARYTVWAAELHDVGKFAVPQQVLEKPGPLAPDEVLLMHEHTLVGERILAAVPQLSAVARLVRASHERWDGHGYPDGLAGEEIPLGSRVVFACDAFDAMTSTRPYRSAMSVPEALQELRACGGTQFDVDVVAALIKVSTNDAVLSAA